MLRPMIVPGAAVNRTTRGFSVVPTAKAASFGTNVKLYKYKSMSGDYLTCRTWDGTTEGDTDIYIAKPYKLRRSIASETIDGTLVSYTYASDSERTATDGTNSETQKIVPRYLVDDLVWGITATTAVTKDNASLTILDMNIDGRAWAA